METTQGDSSRLIAARLRKGSLDRTVSRAARRLRGESQVHCYVDEIVIDDILGGEPHRTDIKSLVEPIGGVAY